jgi:uncharacterized protein
MNATDANDAIARIAICFRLADIYVFGSRAEEILARLKGGERRQEEQPVSDIDIGIRPLRGVWLSPKDLVDLTIELEDLFDAKRVDLVLLSGADPFLALNIIRGELIYTADFNDQARYELYVLRRAGDLFPLKKARMDMIMDGNGR